MKAWKVRCLPSVLNLMFPNLRGGVIDQKGFIALLVKVQVEAGLALDTTRKDGKRCTIWGPRYDWHDLRHDAASNLLNDGIDLKLQTWIGHENIQLTVDVYGHLVIDAKKGAAFGQVRRLRCWMKKRKGRGGRPRERNELKKAPISIRAVPGLRAEIVRRSEVNGLSFTQLVERRGLEGDQAA